MSSERSVVALDRKATSGWAVSGRRVAPRLGWKAAGVAALAGGAAVGVRWGPGWSTLGLVGWAAGLGWLAIVDAATRRLPTRLIYTVGGWTIVWLSVAAGVHGDWARLTGAAGSGLVAEGAFALVALALDGGLGWGDVRLVGLIGLGTGWEHPVLTVLAVGAGLMAAAVAGTVGVIAGRWTWQSGRPLGTFLAAAAVVAVTVTGLGS